VVTVRVSDAVGEYGERLAAEHLRADGMEVLDQRWRCRLGELDLVAADGGCLVVCEVKTRRSVVAGMPVDAVTPVKLARLRRLAAAWLADHDSGWPEVRIDVVSIVLPRHGAPVVDHLRAVSW
jgi:putative endonuclease